MEMNASSSPNRQRNDGVVRCLFRSSIQTLLLATLILTITAAFGVRHCGTLGSFVAYLQGDRIVVDEPVKTVSVHSSNGPIVIDYRLTNLSGRRVKLAGVATSCTCTALEGIPTILEVGEARTFSAKIDADATGGGAIGDIQVFTDEPETPEVKLSYIVQAAPTR